MSMLGARRSRGTSPMAAAYGSAFVGIVHRVLAAAYAAIPKANLSKMQEPSITGLIVQKMRAFLEDPKAPRWAARLAVHDDPPLNVGGTQGKKRPRIDIEVESVIAGPRPRFQFEAKRLNKKQGVPDYLGADGLGCFVSGKYAAAHAAAGMLAYLQSGTLGAWAKKIESGLDGARSKHGLSKTGPAWSTFKAANHALPSFRSEHQRSCGPIVVFHTLLVCF